MWLIDRILHRHRMDVVLNEYRKLVRFHPVAEGAIRLTVYKCDRTHHYSYNYRPCGIGDSRVPGSVLYNKNGDIVGKVPLRYY